MPKVKIKCFVVGYHFKWMQPDEAPTWTVVSGHDGKLTAETIHVQQHEFEVEVPEINIVASKVQGLEAAKAAALAEYQGKVAEINERLSKLLAIEHDEVAA